METNHTLKNILVLIVILVLAGLGVWWYRMNTAPTTNSRMLSAEEVARVQAELAANTTPLTATEVETVRKELSTSSQPLSQEETARIKAELSQ